MVARASCPLEKLGALSILGGLEARATGSLPALLHPSAFILFSRVLHFSASLPFWRGLLSTA